MNTAGSQEPLRHLVSSPVTSTVNTLLVCGEPRFSGIDFSIFSIFFCDPKTQIWCRFCGTQSLDSAGAVAFVQQLDEAAEGLSLRQGQPGLSLA